MSQRKALAFRSWKKQRYRLFARASRKEHFPVDILVLVQCDPCWISDLQKCMVVIVLFKPTKFVATRTLEQSLIPESWRLL